MKNFSSRQRLQVFVDVVYARALLISFHFTECSMLASFNFQMYSLSVVAFLLSLWLKLDLCAVYLVLKVFSVRPMYDSSLWLSWRVTVAWYTMLSVRQLPSSGHWFCALQLQFFCVAGCRV